MSNEIPRKSPDGPKKGDTPQKQYVKTEGGSNVPKHIEKKNIPEVSTDEERLRIARAIVGRQYKEQRWVDSVIHRETGQQAFEKEPTPDSQEVQVQHMAITIKHIEETGSEENSDSVLQRYFDMAEISLNEDNLATEEDFKRMDASKKLIARRMRLYATLRGESEESQEISLTYGLAREIAHEYNASPADVFEDDELYEELLKRQYQDPTKLAQSYMIDVERITPAIMSELYEIDLMGKLLRSGKSLEEAQEELQREQADPNIRAHIDQETELEKEVKRIEARAEIKRLWGEEALQQLDNELQERLGIKDRPSDLALSIVHRARLDALPSETEEERLVKDSYTTYVFMTRVNPSERLEEQIDMDPEVGDILDRYVFSNGEQIDYQWRVNALPTAKRLAYEQGIELEEIYNNPELFTELQRQYFTAETFTEVELARVEERFGEERVTERSKLKYLVERAEQGEPIDGQEQLLNEYYATEQGKAAIRELASRERAEAMQAIEAKITELWRDGDRKGDTQNRQVK